MKLTGFCDCHPRKPDAPQSAPMPLGSLFWLVTVVVGLAVVLGAGCGLAGFVAYRTFLALNSLGMS